MRQWVPLFTPLLCVWRGLFCTLTVGLPKQLALAKRMLEGGWHVTEGLETTCTIGLALQEELALQVNFPVQVEDETHVTQGHFT